MGHGLGPMGPALPHTLLVRRTNRLDKPKRRYPVLSLLLSAALAAPAAADLTIDAIDADYNAADDTVTLYVTVKNTGDGNSGKFYVGGFASKDWDACESIENDFELIANIAPDDVEEVELTFPASHADLEGIHLFVDVDDRVEESNEKNNTGISYILEEDPNEPANVSDWYWITKPDCLGDLFDDNGWPFAAKLDTFYSKIRIL